MSSRVMIVVVMLLGVASVTACGLVSTAGSGPVTTEARQVGPFDRIEVSNGVRVSVQIGPAQSVELQAHENLHALITTNVEGGVLKILSTSLINAVPAPQVTIVVPSLTGVSASGGSQVTANGITADMFGIEISGGAAFTPTGTANLVALEASGGSRANAFGLVAQNVVLDVSGGANAEVHGTQSVSGSVSGGARATVTGGASVSATSSGGGSIVTQ